MGSDDKLESLGAQEVARLLRLHPRRVYQLAAAGVLPCVRLGRSVRFRRAALERWAEAQEARVGDAGDGGSEGGR